MVGQTRQILVLNAGSSSLKLDLFDADTEAPLVERETSWSGTATVRGEEHARALEHLLAPLDLAAVTAVGHRVVHGGSMYQRAVRVDAEVKRTISDLAQLAPLHNQAALAVIEAVERVLPGVPQVVAFDTAFHQSLPPIRYLYSLPYHWYTDWGIRRFGFHGLSHGYCAQRAAELLGKPLVETRLVTCHLGHGCSLAAVDGGRSIATTMGFTPLEGLMMGTRAGSVDPGVLLHVQTSHHLQASELAEILNHQSGLKGISGLSGDMREVEMAMVNGNARAALAFEMFVARIREGIAAMVAALEGVDALVFTAGIGEHSARVRAAVLSHLGWLGVTFDQEANAAARPDVDIAAGDSLVRALVIHTRENLMILRETRRVIAESP